jgi:hypothetical protein
MIIEFSFIPKQTLKRLSMDQLEYLIILRFRYLIYLGLNRCCARILPGKNLSLPGKEHVQ